MTLLDNLVALHDAGHSWMDAPVAASIAANASSPQDAVDQANSYSSLLGNTLNGVAHAWDDPVLYQTPSPAMQVRRYLSDSVSMPPIAATDIASIQQKMQAKGYGTNLPLGAWTGAWAQQYNQASYDYTSQIYNGEHTAAIPAHKAAHGFLSAFLPTHIIGGLIGMAKALPRDTANLLSDAAGAVQALNPVAYGIRAAEGKSLNPIGVAASASSTVNNLTGGKHTTAESYAREHYTAAQLINDVSTALLVVPGVDVADAAVMGARTVGKSVAEEGLARTAFDVSSQASRDAAVRGPGIVARSLGARTQEQIDGDLGDVLSRFGNSKPLPLNPLTRTAIRRISTNALLGTGLGAATAAATGNNVLQGASEGAGLGVLGGAFGGILNKHVFDDTHPILARTAPWTAKLMDADGLYYRARTMAAMPYRVPLIRGIGNAYTKTLPLSLAVHGSADLAGMADPNNPTAQAVNQGDHWLDPLDTAFRNATSGVTGHHISFGLNDLALILHGDLPTTGLGVAGSAAQHMGEQIGNKVNQALGSVGATDAMQRALQAAFPAEKPTIQTIIDRNFHGDTAAFNQHISDKILDAAVAHEVETRMKMEYGSSTSADDWKAAAQQMAHDIWTDKPALESLYQKMVTSPNELEARWRREMIDSRQSFNDFHNDGWQYHQAKTLMRTLIGRDDIGSQMVFPHTWGQIADSHTAQSIHMRPGEIPAEHTQAFLSSINNQAPAGAVGIAKTTTISRTQAHAFADALTQRFGQIADMPRETAEEIAALRSATAEAMNGGRSWLAKEGNLDRTNLMRYTDPEALITAIRNRADTLGSPIQLALDADPRVKEMVNAMHALGYQPWYGTDIGHALTFDQAPANFATENLTRARRLVSAMGLNTEHFRTNEVAAYRTDRVTAALHQAMADGRISVGGYVNATTIRNYLHDQLEEDPLRSSIKASAFELTRKLRDKAVSQAAGSPESRKLVMDALRKEISTTTNPLALKRQDMVDILTKDVRMPHPDGGANPDITSPFMDEHSANEVYNIYHAAANYAPGYMIGLQRFADLVGSAGFQLGQTKIADAPVIGGLVRGVAQKTGTVGANYTRLRDDWRFALSPAFGFRRVFKTNLKMVQKGLVPTTDPVGDLVKLNAYRDAHNYVEKVTPWLRNQGDPDLDMALHQADVFGIYSPRQYMAHAAWQMKQAGMSDKEISDNMVAIFEYGSHAKGEGRTALERTMNTIWFPFSFEKTVMRNASYYLMDHPAQTLLINAGLDAYDQFSRNHPGDPLAGPWLHKHVPLLNEVTRLNPFAHGLSPGEFGGLNAPLLHAFFLPQSWDKPKSGGSNADLFGRYLPAVKDVARVYKETMQQASITEAALQNTADWAQWSTTGHRPPFAAYRPTELPSAQRTDAYAMRDKLIAELQPVLDKNASLSTADQLRFPDTTAMPKEWRGEVVSRSTIDQLIHHYYPAYDPAAAGNFAREIKQRTTVYLDSLKGDPRYQLYSQFAQIADAFNSRNERDEYSPEQVKTIQEAMHKVAVQIALHGDNGSADAGFKTWYDATFSKVFAPLEQVS